MKLFYQEDRDNDFYNVCERIRGQNPGYISVSDIVKQAIYCEAESFYLSELIIARMIDKIKKGEKPTTKKEAKQELYKEIEKRFRELDQSLSSIKQGKLIDQQTAPRFYISETRATCLYYDLLKSKRKENAIRNRARVLNSFFRLQ